MSPQTLLSGFVWFDMSEGSRTGRWSGTDLGQVEGGLGRLSQERTAAEGVRGWLSLRHPEEWSGG